MTKSIGLSTETQRVLFDLIQDDRTPAEAIADILANRTENPPLTALDERILVDVLAALIRSNGPGSSPDVRQGLQARLHTHVPPERNVEGQH